MIYDRIERIAQYRGLSPGLDLVIQWFSEHLLEELPMGKTELDSERVFVNVMKADTRPQEQAHFEVHQNYMDLQVVLQGCESFCTGEASCPAENFDAGADVGFCDGPIRTQGVLYPGWFALFLTQEPHMPTLHGPQGAQTIKKAVFKIRADHGRD